MITWFVLAGGDARRMGRSKSDVIVGDRSLLDHVTAAVGPHQVVGPEVTGGPANALITAARGVHTEAVGVIAVDMPLVGRILPTLRGQWAGCTSDALVTRDGRPQWLCAIYRRAPLLTAATSFGSTVGIPLWRIAELLDVTYLDVTDEQALVDVDTPEDAARVDGWITRRGASDPS